MDKTNPKRIQSVFKRTKYFLIIGILFLIATILTGIGTIKEIQKPLPEAKDIIEMEKTEENIEEKYAKLTIQSITSSFAAYGHGNKVEDSNDKLYFAISNNILFVVEMDNATFAQLDVIHNYDYNNEEANKVEPITIKGTTKKFSEEQKKIVISSYNNLIGQDIVTEENFQDYFGEVYINMIEQPQKEFVVLLIITILLSIMTSLFFLLFIVRKVRQRTIEKKYNLEELKEELEHPVKEYKEQKLYFGKKYIIAYIKQVMVLPYEEIQWIYPYEFDNMNLKKEIIIKLKNQKKKYRIAKMSVNKKKEEDIFNEIYDYICMRAPQSLKGYTKENKKKIKENKDIAE